MSAKFGMSEAKDTPVKVFGWTITSVFSPVCQDPLSSSSPVLHEKENSSSSSSSSSPTIEPHMMNNEFTTDNTSLKISSDLNKESKETSEDSDDQQHSEITTITSEEEKATELKKPDKILPCPRCNSLDTKFCYYNNYNVNQPRHFCRNCQRYWTAGGSMRTVPVGSGRRKNKGWVSSDHYLHVTTENTDNYNSSSTKFLSFESSGSVVTEDAKRQSNEMKLSHGSVSQEHNFPGFLPPQVVSPVSPPWPYQYPLNPSFYHMPGYWGCAVPFWSTQETSTCLGKRTRESKDACVRTRFDSESQSINNEATNNHMWCPVPMNHEKTEQLRMFINESRAKSNNNRVVPEKFLNMQANPAAMARSMNFMESI